MSSPEQVLIVDTRTINTPLEVAGTAGLDTLLLGDQRVVFMQDVLREVRDGPASLVAKFNAWFDSVSGGNGQIWEPDYRTTPGGQAGDRAIREWAATNYEQIAARFLSDDAGIYHFERNLGFDANSLHLRGQYAAPYFWTGEYLAELLLGNKITATEYNSIVGDIRRSSTWDTIPSSPDRTSEAFTLPLTKFSPLISSHARR